MTTGDGTGQTLTFPEHLLRTLGQDSFCWKDTVVGGTGSHLVAMRESLSETGTNPRGKRYTHIKGLESWSQGHAQSQVFLGLSSLLPTDGRGDTFLLMLAANRNDLPQQVRPVPNYRNQALL